MKRCERLYCPTNGTADNVEANFVKLTKLESNDESNSNDESHTWTNAQVLTPLVANVVYYLERGRIL